MNDSACDLFSAVTQTFCIFEQRNIQIASDGGRVCRPLVIADRGVSRVKEHHMKELKVNIDIFQIGSLHVERLANLDTYF